ncbi:MAG: ribonuclease HI family protein [Candidatus Pacebacteria bacterium]|nr:ribonuclease HI family protein [Candidatus Paceibacterota bacterium]PIR61313.1 MAG: ribonuclease H [Candidatus Pacebacteria bacterium CG10_big_fil_rev_8_21_14_0_10_45_6]
MKLTLFSDGGARGNPGPAAVGVVCFNDKSVVFEFGKYLGETTNNVAEYTAVILGLEQLQKTLKTLPDVQEITWKLDSKLVVEQLARRWKIKEPRLRNLAQQCWQLLAQLSLPCNFQHVPREENAHADALVNTTLDAI